MSGWSSVVSTILELDMNASELNRAILDHLKKVVSQGIAGSDATLWAPSKKIWLGSSAVEKKDNEAEIKIRQV